MADFDLDKYISEDSRYGVNVREALRNKFEVWLWGTTRQLSEQVFAVTGPFGIGKTWFLRYVEASAASDTRLSSVLPRNYTAMYIDWREALDGKTTPRTFINEKKRAINALRSPFCLCVDNIPGSNGASEDLNAFEEMLFRALSDGAFLLLVQEHPRSRGWSQMIPAIGTEPYRLGEFIPDAVSALGGNESFYERSFGHPYLTRLLIEHPESDTETYTKLINAWLQDRGLFNKREQILQVAYPLSLIPNNDLDWPQTKNVLWREAVGGSMPREWESVLKLEIIESLQWLMIQAHEGKIASPRWYLPIQKCLRECFRYEQPALYAELQGTLQGGAA